MLPPGRDGKGACIPPSAGHRAGSWETLLPCPASVLGLGNLVPAVRGRFHGRAERGVSGEAEN